MSKLNDCYQMYLADHDLDSLLIAVRAYALKKSRSEDIAQSVTITVMEKLGCFDPARGTFAGWVSAIARNASTDAHRDAARLSAVSGDVLDHFASATAPEPILTTKTRAAIMDETHPDIMEMLLAGLSIQAIAKRMQLSQSQIVRRIRASRKNILGEATKNTSERRIRDNSPPR